MKKLFVILSMICFLLCGCNTQDKGVSIVSNLDNLKMNYYTNLTCNDAIPVTIATTKERKDLKLKLISDQPLQYDVKLSLVNDFDENKDANEQYQTLLASYKQDGNSYMIYDGYLYLEDLFKNTNNNITKIQICDGEQVLKDIDVDVKMSTIASEHDLSISEGHALVGKTSIPSTSQTYENDFVLEASEDIFIKCIYMDDEELSIDHLEIKVHNQTYDDVDAKNINMEIKEGTKIMMRPKVQLKEANKDILYTRNYIYCVEYEVNGETRKHYFDSGVITSFDDDVKQLLAQ